MGAALAHTFPDRQGPRVPGIQQPQQSLKKEMTLIHNEHPVIFGVLVHLEAFNPQNPALPAQIRGMKPRTNPGSGTKTPSTLQGDFLQWEGGKAVRSAHSQLDFHSPLCSLTPGHRISMAEDQPLISGVCRKLGLMGGPGSQDGAGRLDQQLPGQSQRPGPSEATYLGRTFGVSCRGDFGGYPRDWLFGEGTALTSCLLPSQIWDGDMEQGSGENMSLCWALEPWQERSSSSGCCDRTQKGRCL